MNTVEDEEVLYCNKIYPSTVFQEDSTGKEASTIRARMRQGVPSTALETSSGGQRDASDVTRHPVFDDGMLMDLGRL